MKKEQIKGAYPLLAALHALQDLRPLLMEAAAQGLLARNAYVGAPYDCYRASWPSSPAPKGEPFLALTLCHNLDDEEDKRRWRLEVSFRGGGGQWGRVRLELSKEEKRWIMDRMAEIKAKGRGEE